MKKLEIVKFEFITPSYSRDNKYKHWSRVYEWKYVLDQIKILNPKSVHNTACGGLNVNDTLHLTFCSDLDELCDNCIHSDLWGGSYPGVQTKPNGDKFTYYDVTKKLDQKFDLVLNISTLEHLSPNDVIISLDNLIEQVSVGGDLILTFDYPDIDVSKIEDYLGVKMNRSMSESVRHLGLQVIILHIKKTS